MSDAKNFYGKYRGTVINNVDPEQRGRIQAMVPDVTGFAIYELGLTLAAYRRARDGYV